MKYKYIEVDRTHDFCQSYSVIVLQVKKWYGWCTFCTIEDITTKAYKRANKLLNLLRGEN